MGLEGDCQLPQAVEAAALLPLSQMISPRIRKPRAKEILDQVAVQRQIGPAAQVGNVETNPAAGRQNAIDFRHYLAQEVPVFVQGQVGVVLLAHIVGRGSDHQVDAGGGQGVHPRRRLGQDGIYGRGRQGIFPILAGPAAAGKSS